MRPLAIVLAIAGVAAAVGIGLAANAVTGDSVGLSADPLSAGDELAPASDRDRDDDDGHSATTPALPPVSGADDEGGEDSGSEDRGSDESGSDDSGSDESGSHDSRSDDSGSDDSGSDNSGSDHSGSSDNSGSRDD